MATVIFPDAKAKIFLTASAEVRADRRYQQIIKKGIAADYEAILKDLQDRDTRDRQRSVAPLQQAQDAALLDTSHLNIEQAVNAALDIIQSQN
jgi:cytidylate kinase